MSSVLIMIIAVLVSTDGASSLPTVVRYRYRMLLMLSLDNNNHEDQYSSVCNRLSIGSCGPLRIVL